MGNSTSNNTKNGVSIHKIINTAQDKGTVKIRKNVNKDIVIIGIDLSSSSKKISPINRQMSESQSSMDSNESAMSTDSISSISCNKKNTNVVKHNAQLSLNIESPDCDIIKELKVDDVSHEIDKVQLVIGHRTFDAVKDDNNHCFIIHAYIPNFLLRHSNPLRLDIYPSTTKDPTEIVYYYDKLIIDENLKEQCQKNRIHDKDLHITYLAGLVF